MYMYIMHFTRILSLSLNIQYKFDTFVNGWYIVRIQVKLASLVYMCILRHLFSMELRNIQFLIELRTWVLFHVTRWHLDNCTFSLIIL